MNIHKGHREHMRNRFLQGGLEGFADHEALELLLYYSIPRKDTNPIAHALMEHYGSLSAVLSAPVEELQKVEGVGEASAILLRLVPLLEQKARLSETEQVMNSTERIGAYLLERFSQERDEVVYQLCLDQKRRLLSCKRLGEGAAASVELDIRRLVKNALLASASGVILAHNHPSGVALPSPEDYVATDKAETALKTIDVVLLDHIIVADGEFISLADSGYLRRRRM